MKTATVACAAIMFMSMNAVAWGQAKPVTPSTVMTPMHQVDATFSAWDMDHGGSLSPQEFRDGWQQARQALQVSTRLRKQFAVIDGNRSGAIEANEYGNLLLIKQAGKSAPPLAAADANKDGKLQFGEYLKLVQSLAPRQPR